MEDRMRNLWRAVASAFAATLVATVNAYAVNLINDCSGSCNTNCTLQGDLNCNNKDGITLSGGADLDMDGHFLTCTTNCPTSGAIKMTAGASIVKNTSASEAGIIGSFTNGYGVSCQSNTSSEVDGIRIELTGSNTVGIRNCARVHNNVLLADVTASGNTGIIMADVANSDYVNDNYIEGFTFGIQAGRTHNITAQHNHVVLREVTGAGGANEVGIAVSVTSGSPSVFVLNNALAGDATLAQFLSFSGTIDYRGNVCDPDNALCQACSNCAQVYAPYNL